MKRLVFIITCVLLNHNVFAQEANENAFDLWLTSFNEGIALFNSEKYKEAIPHFENALTYIDSIDFSTNEETQTYPIENLYNLAISHFKLGNFETCTQLLEKAILWVNDNEKLKYTYLEAFWEDLGHSYININIDKALYYRKKLAESLAKNQDTEPLRVAQAHYVLAYTYQANGDNDSFYEYLKEVANTLEENKLTDTDYFAFTSYDLGLYFNGQEDYKTSVKYLNYAEKLVDYLKVSNTFNPVSLYFNQGFNYFKLQQHKKAIETLEKLLDSEVILSKNALDELVVTLQLLGESALKTNQYNTIKDTYTRFESHIKETSLEGDAYSNFCVNYGTVLIKIEAFDEALNYLNKAKQLLETSGKTSGLKPVLVANSMGLYHLQKGHYNKSKTAFINALGLAENIDSNGELLTANIQGNLANVYRIVGDYSKSETLYKLSLESKSKLFGQLSPEYIEGLIAYANLLIENNDLDTAEDKLVSIDSKITDNQLDIGPLGADLDLTLGNLYLKKLQPKKSLSRYAKAQAYFEKENLTNVSKYAYALAGKGNVTYMLGDMSSATQLLNTASAILDKTLGASSLERIKIIITLAEANFNQGNVSESMNLYIEILELLEQSVTPTHHLYGTVLGQYGLILLKQNKIDEALETIDAALKNIAFNYGEESTPYSSLLRIKGASLIRQKKFNDALSVNLKVLQLIESTNNTDKEYYFDSIFLLALNYHSLGNYKDASTYFAMYEDGMKTIIKSQFAYRSENEKKQFLNRLDTWANYRHNLALDPNYTDEIFLVNAVNSQLVYKGLLLNSSIDAFSKLKTLKDKTIDLKLEELQLLKEAQSKFIGAMHSKKSEDKSDLNLKINTLESELISIYAERFNTITNAFDQDWKSIKSKLSQDEIAIEFTDFRVSKSGVLTSEKVYVSYLIHKDWTLPKMVELFAEKDLKAILKNNTPNQLYQTRGAKGASTTDTKSLYDLIWKPLEEHLNGIETVYYSPSGLLNQIPFSALDTEDQPILVERYNLVQLSSTYVLTEAKSSPKQNNTLFIGGVNYDTTVASASKPENELASITSLKNTSGTRSLGSSWNYLPGTLQEIEQLQSSFKNQNTSFSTLSGKEATETVFKNLSGNSPNVIHIATHGFFFENPKENITSTLDMPSENVYQQSEDPLLRSGLIFAGANTAWTNGGSSNAEDDGILTALEISNLDLFNTDMVVLSACETGLGDIDGSEGVYGMQRAFKMAGVDLIVMSLWEVPDAETAEFMTLFYSNWLNGQPVREAFRNTQLKMASTYIDSPEKWAAFVLFE